MAGRSGSDINQLVILIIYFQNETFLMDAGRMLIVMTMVVFLQWICLSQFFCLNVLPICAG